MLRKLTVFLMVALFSVSVAGLSYAEPEPGDIKPAAKPAVKSTDKPAANPCAAGEKEMGKKKKAKKKAAKKKKKSSKYKGEVQGPAEE